MKNKVYIVTTGGTIEKTYNELDGTLLNRGSQLRKMIHRLRLPYTEIYQRDLLCKDSLEMTDEDREKILTSVKHLMHDKLPIIILHGTDTMEVTAQYLYDHLQDVEKPIIFTGAMTPFGFENSDALQNFTEALFAAHLVQPGVYISMHGTLHPLPGVRKNRKRKTFEKKGV